MTEADIDPDKSYSGVLTIKNSGSADIKGLFVNFTSTDDIVITDGTASRYFEDIPIGTTKQITMKFRTDGGYHRHQAVHHGSNFLQV